MDRHALSAGMTKRPATSRFRYPPFGGRSPDEGGAAGSVGGLGVLHKLGVTPAEAGVQPEVSPLTVEAASQDGYRPSPV